MIRLLRTIGGLAFGWLAAGLLALLGWFQHGGPGAVAAKTHRRTFVRNAALGATGSVLALVGAGFGLLMWPNKTGAFGSVLNVSPDNIPEVNGVPYRNIAGKFFLVHNADGLMALYTKCPHLGCTVPWNGPAEAPNAFQCPCHGSLYDYNGVRTGGPAPRPMDLMAVTVNPDGTVAVDTGDIVQRAAYDPAQAAPYTA